MHSRILLAVDDASVCESARDYLSRNGYLTSTAASREAVSRVGQGSADLLVVDVAGHHEEALRVCQAVRSVSEVPIIVLSSRDDSEERIKGFDAGADDYLVKPLNLRELMGRIRAVSRRASLAHRESVTEPRGYSFGDWRLDGVSHTLHHTDGSAHVLSASDFRLLEVLVTHAQQAVPRERILRILHGPGWQRFECSIEARMSRLRQLLRSRKLIRSVYGAGYVFESAVVPDYLPLPPGSDASWLVR